jgi:hypothetical protein
LLLARLYLLLLSRRRLLLAWPVEYRSLLVRSRLLLIGRIGNRLRLRLVRPVIWLGGTAKAVVRLIGRGSRTARRRVVWTRLRVNRLVNRVTGIVGETRIGAAAIVAAIVSPAIIGARIIPIDRTIDGSGIIERLRP